MKRAWTVLQSDCTTMVAVEDSHDAVGCGSGCYYGTSEKATSCFFSLSEQKFMCNAEEKMLE